MAQPEPLVSVVIPLYNKRGTIVRAIGSVLSQTVTGLELIIIDDGSSDGSKELAAGVSDPRIRIESQANAGPGRARNAGVELASAPVIAFLDADDEWHDGYLAAGLAALDAHPEASTYVCGYDAGAFAGYMPNLVLSFTTVAAQLAPPPAETSPARLLAALNALHSSSTMIRTDVFRRYGGFYDKDRCLWGEDSFLWAQVLFAGPVFWDPAIHVIFHVEDSDLGFAVKQRSEARPLAYKARELSAGLPPQYVSGFLKLAKAMAAFDAAELVQSGYPGKALALRRNHGIPLAKTLLGDVKRFAKRGARVLRAVTS